MYSLVVGVTTGSRRLLRLGDRGRAVTPQPCLFRLVFVRAQQRCGLT